MNHGSLFSGIGGFDLAAEWMGWENIFHCEWNDFGKQVLKYYWPKAISYDDITKTDFTIHRGKIDILTGGFPCQPYSVSGKRKGKEDDRHLWPEMLRAIREIQPEWIVGENVYGLLNWNGGLVFEQIQADLEAEGYEVQPYILPAVSVNAPHRRDRIWFVAHRSSERCNHGSDNREERQISHDQNGNATKSEPKGNGWECGACEIGENGNASNANSIGRGRLRNEGEKTGPQQSNELSGSQCGISTETGNATNSPSGRRNENNRKREPGQHDQEGARSNWENFPTQSPVCSGNDGFSSQLDGITFSKWRNESIKAGGNAIVPQVVHQIFKAIEKYNNLDKS